MNVLGKDNLVAAIDEAITAIGQSDEYFRGMCNGMLYVKSLIEGKVPEYFKTCKAIAIPTDKGGGGQC